MKTLLLKDISRKYDIGKNQTFTALRQTNISFDSTGLVSIIGKSGSGKSTLINIIAKIDEPSSGEIFLYGKPYSKIKKNELTKFYNRDIGIVFQQYNLLDEFTTLENVILPSLIGGENKRKAMEKAKVALDKVDVPIELFNNKVNKLSGGERQRVAIARAIVNEPKILLCDEPTGALDSLNSENVLSLLKKISKKTLVIVVSHNLQLVKKYSDRIIEISDGKIIDDQVNNCLEDNIKFDKSKKKSGSSWISKLASNNYRRRIKRNLITSLAFTITLTMSYLVFGFSTNKDKSVQEACFRQFDYGSGSLSEEVKSGGNGLLTLTKSTRPNIETLLGKTKITEKYEICPNFASILPQNIEITYDAQIINDLFFTPIYSFSTPYVSDELLIQGSLPIDNNGVIINTVAYEIIKKEIKKEPLNEYLNFNHEAITTYISEFDEYVSDTFHFSKRLQIKGIVKEINYLPSPKIYYSYSNLLEYTKENVLINLSTYNNETITWYDRVLNAENYSYLSSYSYLLFLKNFNDKKSASDLSIFEGKYVFTSQSLLLEDSLFNFLSAAEYGVSLFMIITFIGAILILSIMSFTSFSEDHKISAILSSIGASNNEIQEIYLEESLLNGLISFVFSIGLSVLLSKLINLIIFNLADLKGLIQIPFLEFMGIKLLFPLLILGAIFIIVYLSTTIPIYFSKQKSIKGELQSL